MQSIAYLIDMEENLTILDIKGQETGRLLIAAAPCDSKFQPLSEDVFADDPQELVSFHTQI